MAARWKLATAHYLVVESIHGEDVVYEHKETNRDTGRQKTIRYPVPLHLNPEDPADWNDRNEGAIIVTQGDNPSPRDIIFLGEPTPDMIPLNAEAEAISDKFRHKWVHPIESLPGTGEAFAEQLLAHFQAQIEAIANNKQPQAMSLKGVTPEAFAALQAQVQQLLEQNAALQAQQLDKAEAKPERRV